MSLEVTPAQQYAEWRGCSVRTVQRERSQRTGPPFVQLGRKIIYRVEAIEHWLKAKEQTQPRAHNITK